jgi:hypothetical protein
MRILDLAVSECITCGKTIAGEEFITECKSCEHQLDYSIFEMNAAETSTLDDTVELDKWFLKTKEKENSLTFFDAGQAMDYVLANNMSNYEISRVP